MMLEHLESNVRSYSRSFPAVFSKAKGEYIFDRQGKRYIDFLAGAGSLNYGHNEPYIKNKLIDYLQEDNICHSLDLLTEAKARFLETLNGLILGPRKMSYVAQFSGPTGTNAVEAALKLARKVTGRQGIISFTNGFHGVTLGSLSVSGNNFYRKAAMGSLAGNVTFMPYDGYYGSNINTANLIEKILDDRSSGVDLPAAMIAETIQGEGGVNTASDDWLRKLEQICRERGIILIIDDIQSGCGRTGDFFSFEKAGISPDIITLSKSLSGSGLPLALVLIKPELDQWQPGEHNGTFRGNNPAFVTATAALERYWSDNGLQIEVARKARRLQSRIESLIDSLGDGYEHKGRGMMQGLRCPTGEIARTISTWAFEAGLIIETCGTSGNVLKFLMPLVISDEALDAGMEILGNCAQRLEPKIEQKLVGGV